MAEKIKRKHDYRALKRLKIMLLGYIFCIVLSSTYVPFWLGPPFDSLTPFIYLALFLSWIPILWKAHRRIRFDRWLIALILLCSVASGSIASYSAVMRVGNCHASNFHHIHCSNRTYWKTTFHRVTLGEIETNIFRIGITFSNWDLF